MNREERQRRILNALVNGPKTNTKIKEALQDEGHPIQDKELAYDLKELDEDKKEISWEPDRKDRRKKWYFLRNKDKAWVEKNRFEGIEFIKSIEPERFGEAEARKKGLKVHVSIFSDLKEETKEKLDRDAENIAEDTAKALVIAFKSFDKKPESLRKGYILTVEMEGVKP